MRDDFDIIVVGGGLVGGCLALALESSGLHVLVVESASDEERKLSPAGDRAIALAYGSFLILKQLGIWAGVEPSTMPIKKIHVSDQGHFGKTRLSSQQEGVEALGYVVKARVLEDYIYNKLTESSVELICPAQVTDLESGTDGVGISLKHGEQSLSLTTKLTVGADGGNSTVRRLLGIDKKIIDYGQTAIATTVKPEIDHEFTAFERFTPSGPLAFLPTDDRCCSVIWTRTTNDAKELMRMSGAEFIESLQSCFGYRLGALALKGPRGAFPLQLVRVERMVSERVVLVGNAVHQLHPVAGQGLNLGLRDIAQLAELILGIDGQNDDPGGAGLLQQYAKIRQRDHNMAAGMTDGLVRIFASERFPFTFVRNVALQVLDHCPWSKHAFALYAMGLGGRVPRLTQQGTFNAQSS